jgi:hypothetical protein
LAVDWDYQQLHLVAATVHRGKVEVERAAAWREESSPNLGNTQALGQLLRERMKAAGIAPAPVLVCVGRDRLIFKDLRFPAVPVTEEPALVRFQAIKELTHSADEILIDYARANDTGSTGEQRALALIIRRELLDAYQSLCRAAGLKLLAVAPRPFGTLACLKEIDATSGPGTGGAAAVLTATDQWVEFCIGSGDQLLLARSLRPGKTLAAEIRRNVTVFASQSPQYPVRAVYVFGDPQHAALCAELEPLLDGMPVRLANPFDGNERLKPQASRGGFAGAVGTLHAWARNGKLPIDFAHPKEGKPPSNPIKRRLAMGAGLAAAVLVAAVGLGYYHLANKDQEIESLRRAKADLDGQFVMIEEDAKRIKALDEWTETGIVWLDEIYDLTDRFPDTDVIRLFHFAGDPLTAAGKDKHVAKMSLEGITQNYEVVNTLSNRLAEEGTKYRVDAAQYSRNTRADRFRFGQQFSTRVDLEKRPPGEYTRRLPEQSREGRNAPGTDASFFPGDQP